MASNRVEGSPPSIYVGCALTFAPGEYREQVEELKDVLRTGYEVFDFVGLTKGTAEDVYRWDIEHCVADCDLFVPLFDYPATMLGWETCRAIDLGKTVLGVVHENTKVSRGIIGAAAVLSTLSLERYTHMLTDVPHLITAQFDSLK